MRKGQRLEEFYNLMRAQPLASTPQQSRDTAARVMLQVENSHAPLGEEKMTIPEIGHWMNVEYGIGGKYIPLINGAIHINANGATGYYDASTDNPRYRLTLSSANGTAFVPVAGFRYPT